MAISDGWWKGCEGKKPTLLIGGSLLRTGFDLTACTWISNSDGDSNCVDALCVDG